MQLFTPGVISNSIFLFSHLLLCLLYPPVTCPHLKRDMPIPLCNNNLSRSECRYVYYIIILMTFFFIRGFQAFTIFLSDETPECSSRDCREWRADQGCSTLLVCLLAAHSAITFTGRGIKLQTLTYHHKTHHKSHGQAMVVVFSSTQWLLASQSTHDGNLCAPIITSLPRLMWQKTLERQRGVLFLLSSAQSSILESFSETFFPLSNEGESNPVKRQSWCNTPHAKCLADRFA